MTFCNMTTFTDYFSSPVPDHLTETILRVTVLGYCYNIWAAAVAGECRAHSNDLDLRVQS